MFIYVLRQVHKRYSLNLQKYKIKLNAKPELHDVGFVKYQSNVEKMRNYMTEIRVDIMHILFI